MDNIGDKVKSFTQQFEFFKDMAGKFVEQNLMEKKQRDENMKKLAFMAENFFKENIVDFESFNLTKVSLKVKKLPHFKGELPKYQSVNASGFDVRAQLVKKITLKPGERFLIPTGLKFEIPKGFEIQVRPRSGWAIREGISLVNTPGTIDSDYRGEVSIIIINHGQEAVMIEDQDRIAQLVVCPVVQAEMEVVEDLSATERGAGGFGSTGLKDYDIIEDEDEFSEVPIKADKSESSLELDNA